jgi:hypothetical protein
MWSTLPDNGIELDLEPLSRMQKIEDMLVTVGKPNTMFLATELLGICVTILAHVHEDPESTLANGPVVEIVRNVVDSLEWRDRDMRIGDPKQRQAE